MQFNLQIDKIVQVQLAGKTYPVAVSGNGIPCLSIGTGTLAQRTTSARFKKSFAVYSSDLYFDERYRLDDPSSLTMEKMVDEVAKVAEQLGLSRYVIFGHSAFGIVALECAKKYTNQVAGIIMAGTPPNSNSQVAARNDAYFETYAEPERKKIDAERREQFAQEDLSALSYSDRFLRGYVYRDAPRYWHIPDFDCAPLWSNIMIDTIFDRLFSTIFPAVDVMNGLETVTCPVFLAAGLSDYNCCPFLWKSIKNLPPHMVISEFKKSGHYPQHEEQELFDERIEEWVRENKGIKI